VRNPRLLVAAGVVLVAVALGVVLLAGSGGDAPVGGDLPTATQTEPLRTVTATLTLEQAELPDSGGRELLVSLPGPQFNTLDVTRGGVLVSLRCFDRGGALVLDQPVDWPLPEEAGYPPHIHRPAARRMLDEIRRCRVTAPGIDFEGRVSGRLPEFG
jgi:hypothetical protein